MILFNFARKQTYASDNLQTIYKAPETLIEAKS